MDRICLISSLVFLFLFVSCEDKKQTDLYKAQICIDNATASTVNSCLNLIEGDNSETASVMRCSAAFISEGIAEDAIIDALENIEGDSGNTTTPAIAALAMSNTATSSAALSTCQATNSKGLISMANLANVATTMKALLGFTDGASAADIDALIDAYVASPPTDSAEKEALGAAIIASQDSLCNPESGTFQGKDTCNAINAAITANPNNPSGVADSMISNIN